MEEFRRVRHLYRFRKIFRKLNDFHFYFIFIYFSIREQQRAQKVFKAQLPLDLPAARNKLLGFGMQLLDSVDPNPDNMVCAGIIHTQSQQVGCLLRLEPNRTAQVCNNILIVRQPKILQRSTYLYNIFISSRCSD